MRATSFEIIAPAGPITALPIRLEQTSSRAAPLLMLAMAGVAGLGLIVPFIVFAAHAASDPTLRAVVLERPSALIIGSLAIATWVAIFCWPIKRLVGRLARRRTIWIDGRLVTVADESFGRARIWTSRIGDFAGLTHHVRASLSGIRQELILVHPDPRKSVLLRVADRIAPREIDEIKALLDCREIAPRTLYGFSADRDSASEGATHVVPA